MPQLFAAPFMTGAADLGKDKKKLSGILALLFSSIFAACVFLCHASSLPAFILEKIGTLEVVWGKAVSVQSIITELEE